MADTEQNNPTKVPVGTNLDPEIFGAISKFAVDEDRSISNMVNVLLKNHPRVQDFLATTEAEAATA